METQRSAAQEKLQGIVNAGQARMVGGLEAMQREYQLRSDVIVKPEAVDVEIVMGEGGRAHEFKLQLPDNNVALLSLTRHARGQFLGRAGIPNSFAESLLELDPELLRENVLRLLPKVSQDGILVRSVEGVAKGILSPSYRRMDAAPVFESYAKASLEHGFAPHAGEVTDTRAFLSFIRPDVVDLGRGEFVVFGHELRTSDYGNGALQLTLVTIRLLCVNGMIGMNALRKVHLGRRFDSSEFGDGEVISLSRKTIELDVRTIRSALRDATRALPAQVDALRGRLVELVGSQNLNMAQATKALQAKGVRKEVIDQARALYDQALPLEAVPQDPGPWRWAQVISLVAKNEQGDVRKDLEEAAFAALAA